MTRPTPMLAGMLVSLLLGRPGGAAQVAPVTQAPKLAGPAAAPKGPSFDQLATKAAAAKEAGQFDDAIQYYAQALAMEAVTMACSRMARETSSVLLALPEASSFVVISTAHPRPSSLSFAPRS